MAKEAKEKRSGHRTQWAAQFAVASELCKRGYEVAFTMGNTTPLADLMVVSPKLRQMFLVDVKGQYRTNPWWVKPKPTPKGDRLFYVLAYVPDDGPNRFFLMTQSRANQLVRNEQARRGLPDDYSFQGFVWKKALQYEDKWNVLPE